MLIEMYAAFHQTQITAFIKPPDKPEMEEADHSSMLMTAMLSEAAASKGIEQKSGGP